MGQKFTMERDYTAMKLAERVFTAMKLAREKFVFPIFRVQCRAMNRINAFTTFFQTEALRIGFEHLEGFRGPLCGAEARCSANHSPLS